MFYGGNAARRFYTTLDISMTGRRPKYEPCTVQAFKKAVSRFPECLENGSSLTVTIDNIGRSTLNSLAIIPELVRDFGFKEVDGEDTLKFIVTRSLDTPNKSWAYVVSKNYRGMSKIQLVRAALIWLEIDNNWDRYPDSQYLRCRAGKRAVKGTWRMEEGRHYDADAIVMRQDCGMTLHPTSEELEAFYTRPWVNEEDEDRR
ncbi:hypothetical protein BDY17DRAFT_303323 [Neohortaea acidophila]|uniref:Uncharacterized protein n=1 Tax=Neohortaea acidophila TaxID=245834 RepID=A0A6A6PKY6_9PEZI|nr:uncharacterized protein BDY17DRAFT_303323 [Neohortaea acidophila]KAF2480153.1 hypothetical protein BDY17DRAFT_303323 [Neohortaea acidophila]